MELDKKYDHHAVEKGLYQGWLEKGYFKAGDKSKKPYSLVIPPPNVTGKLHLGHAWDNSLQDILARYHRLLGYDVLYLPGMDHAGIATQAKVDARLRERGLSRFDLGREKFLEEANAYKEEYASTIRKQWGKLGLSLDYSREAFTLDDHFNKAVNEVFVKLYNEGLIYQGTRIINWDVEAKTAISNIEVIYKEVEGAMYTFKYPLEGQEGFLKVATTRPETMFGDVCVVVNPNDPRYKDLIGSRVLNPANDQWIPIIGDEYVEIDFGTGAMKCTPAHDPNDYALGVKYNLEMPICMNLDGTMNHLALSYEGMDRIACRKKLVDDLKAKGLVVSVDTYSHQVGHSERTDSIVEPMLSKQWFVKMEPLARSVLANQDKDPIRFVPDRFEKTFTSWLENIEDWTISRQLWWGHRIPAYTHKKTKELVVSATPPQDMENYDQDPDVLDTWFSSALWPFVTMGWPKKTEDYQRYYPTDVLVTGYDIILFWVVRMAFEGLHFTQQKPFKDVLIHGLIRDEENRKMSKSLGNGIDPMDVIEDKGVDALRFFLVSNSTAGQDLRYDKTKLEAAWNFINKIYNSSRFVLMYLPEDFKASDVDLTNMSSIDAWILNKMNATLTEMKRLMKDYDFTNVGSLLTDFVWNDFCSWYIELSKSQLQSQDDQVLKATYSTLYTVLMAIVKMISPFMPFVSERIYLALPHEKESINLETWPGLVALKDQEAAYEQVDALVNVIETVRKVRVDYSVPFRVDLAGHLETGLVEGNKDLKEILYKMVKLTVGGEEIKDGLVLPLKSGRLILEKGQLVDKEEEKAKLQKSLDQFAREIARGEKMLSNPNFVNKADPAKVTLEQEKLEQYRHQYDVVKDQLAKLGD